MNVKKVSAIQNNNFTIFSYYRFSVNGNSMFIRKETGCTFFISDALADEIEKGNISSELQYKLISRGFAKVAGVPDIDIQAETIQPTFFLIDLTNKCNMKCSYCLRIPDAEQDSIDDDTLLKICTFIVEYCRNRKINTISIQPWGGEPLLCTDKIIKISEFFSVYSDLKTDICVETNGSLLTDEKLLQLSNHHIRLSFSLDGPPKIHDRQRSFLNGMPSSSVIREKIKLAAQYGYKNPGGICIITDHSIGHVGEILNYCEYDLNMGSIKLNLMRQPAHECDDVKALDETEIQAIANEIVDAISKHRANGGKIRESNTEDRIYNLTGNKNQNICNSKGCCGGKKMISFDMQGRIYPCELTDWKDECIGNIATSIDLCSEIAQATTNHAYFNKKYVDKCNDCPWWFFCRGGCSSSIKYKGVSYSCIDQTECALNCALYPLLTEKLLNKMADATGWFI